MHGAVQAVVSLSLISASVCPVAQQPSRVLRKNVGFACFFAAPRKSAIFLIVL
jgi:hypothetical protein